MRVCVLVLGLLALLPACVIFDSAPQDALVGGCGPDGSVPDGEACVCDDECASGSCFSELVTGAPQGVCFSECTTSRACDDDSVCLLDVCVPRCRRNADCGLGRICAKAVDDAPSDIGGCFALCQADADCRSGNCNLWSGRCLPIGDEPFGEGVSRACTDSGECRSESCFEGGCSTLCSVRAQVCPDNATCTDRGVGDLGFCNLPCNDASDCADLDLGWDDCIQLSDGLGYCDTP